jgi:hypothetical protein
VILLVGLEYYDLRSMMQDSVFARLLAAWREMKRDMKRDMKREGKNERRP